MKCSRGNTNSSWSVVFGGSHWRCSTKKGVLKNLAKFSGKHLFQSPFFNRVVGWGLQLIKKDSGTGVFLSIWGIIKNTFFIEYLRVTASESLQGFVPDKRCSKFSQSLLSNQKRSGFCTARLLALIIFSWYFGKLFWNDHYLILGLNNYSAILLIFKLHQLCVR